MSLQAPPLLALLYSPPVLLKLDIICGPLAIQGIREIAISARPDDDDAAAADDDDGNRKKSESISRLDHYTYRRLWMANGLSLGRVIFTALGILSLPASTLSLSSDVVSRDVICLINTPNRHF